MGIMSAHEAIKAYHDAMGTVEDVLLHPDTENTYAAYQLFVGKYEVWVNARNGDIITMQKQINRL